MSVRIMLVTDAWTPQVNGVVRTLTSVTDILGQWGHDVTVISPDQYRSIPCPSYSEIRLALVRPSEVGHRIAALRPDAVHIATEGPLGLTARHHCLSEEIPFTTAYHTQFPDYLAERTHLPAATFWPYIRWFHRPASAIMVATKSVRDQLAGQGLTQVAHWGRGVDLTQFSPDAPPPALFADLPRPILLYVGRVAVEKNIEAFLNCRHPGSKVVVGDGPAFARLTATYPDARFLGSRQGDELAGCYAGADVLVFPSLTDTFGLVMIEALACGTPVAAYPVQGPIDILTEATGAMDIDLHAAIEAALTRDRERCAAEALNFSWQASASQFLRALALPDGAELAA